MNELVPLLNVENVSASIAFYEAALGAKIENSWELEGQVRWARVRFDGDSLMLNTPEGTSSAERQHRAEFADAVLYLMCTDAPRIRNKLSSNGLPVGSISHEEYGNDEFVLRDPDGYVIRFSSPR
jgi:uncharacterized glyoxalase superfamily protein PhnB